MIVRLTLVILAFLTSTCFLGAIVLAPFFGPKAVCWRLEDFAVGAVDFLALIAPCAILLVWGVEIIGNVIIETSKSADENISLNPSFSAPR
jgi:hypothetical protein